MFLFVSIIYFAQGLGMKRILIGSVAVVSLLAATSAFAADLPARVYTKAPVMAIVYDWTGFYIGGNAGYSWGRASTDGDISGTQSVSEFRTAGPTLLPGFPVVTTIGSVPLSGRSHVDGFIGGGQAGYNWQRGTWLFGLEADFQGSDERGSSDVCSLPGCSASFTANYKLDWFGTVRGRIGFLPTERVLLYATGGLAYGHFGAGIAGDPTTTWGATRAGWTLGAGGEAAIDNHWSVKLEYLYVDLGDVGSVSASATSVTNALNTPLPGFNTVTTTTLTSGFHTHFVDNILRVGLNYRFGGPVVARY
jgi:outer membrane immunogenic protein